MRHLLSVTDLDAGVRDGAARHRGPAQAGAAGPRGAQAADAARAHGRHDVLRELHAHPRLLRDRRQVDERRHDQRVGERVVGGQGRVAARHRGDAGGDRRRLHRRAPPGLGCGAPDGALGGPGRGGRCGRADRPGVGDERRQRRRRHPRAPHAGAARRGDPARPARRPWPAGGSGSSATCCTAGSRARTSSCSRRWAPRSCWSPRPRCCRSGSRPGRAGWASPWRTSCPPWTR